MMVGSRNTVYDFMRRTEFNLKLVEAGAAKDPSQHFEVTQLINSVIGLLMFPSEELIDKLPRKKISEIWNDVPLPRVIYGKYRGEDEPDIHALMRYLRNGFAHYNIQFVNSNNVIQGLYIWNRPNPQAKPDWIAYISIETLRHLFRSFCKEFRKISNTEPEPSVLNDKLAALERELTIELGERPLRLTNPQSFR